MLEGEFLLDALETGEVRVATRGADGGWTVDPGVKQELLRLFRTSDVVAQGGFVDKQAFPVRAFDTGDGVRLVPGGSAVRRGAHVAPGCVLMPPCYVNVGAFVGEGTMVDSHALIGSCAQIGERVHVSAGAQIGGVLEPVGSRPVIVEDDCLVGGQAGLYEGVLVRAGAVIAAGVILTASTPVYDLVHESELARAPGLAPEIPAGAVVIPGARPPRGEWARARGLSASCALIVKYRDAGTDAATALEDALR
jgi:2,3,4,5-tetrahydropyridine-2-carboxylate N-succinyltransferase